ncbi:T6SS effector amidase Tae4 family protein [Marinobacter sp. S6332]|uniref:T6SS effector amidase Tae4 family protein n=1 Tax=Marinobacter sp. S6332 TaxID=2926403 RepID=UPI001FF4F5AE|nr:T6SS effector amidase Tae4 family protein [Marinobacter sp. S6332]MCK0163294.1 type VI secretion system amidase effector protein Tae4 [Marinobacter sp. S6332]
MITFRKLWENHPTIKGDDNPCVKDGKKNFQNQCAIRVGAALARCGFNTRALPGARHCWYHDKSAGHVLAAQELASALAELTIPGIGSVQRLSAKEFMEKADGKNGVVFFKNYWQRSSDREGSPTGDHIDFWNGSRLTDRMTWARFHLRVGGFGMHSLPQGPSDYLAAEEVWFWEVQG